jgi:hypothetical protein
MSHKRQGQDEKALEAVRCLKRMGYDLPTIRKALPALTGITHPLVAGIMGVSRTAVTKTMNAERFQRRMQESIAEIYGMPVDEIFETKHVYDRRVRNQVSTIVS